MTTAVFGAITIGNSLNAIVIALNTVVIALNTAVIVLNTAVFALNTAVFKANTAVFYSVSGSSFSGSSFSALSGFWIIELRIFAASLASGDFLPRTPITASSLVEAVS